MRADGSHPGLSQQLASASKAVSFVFDGTFFVGYVVAESAEGICRVDRSAAFSWEGAKGIVEVLRMLFSDALTVIVSKLDFVRHRRSRPIPDVEVTAYGPGPSASTAYRA